MKNQLKNLFFSSSKGDVLTVGPPHCMRMAYLGTLI